MIKIFVFCLLIIALPDVLSKSTPWSTNVKGTTNRVISNTHLSGVPMISGGIICDTKKVHALKEKVKFQLERKESQIKMSKKQNEKNSDSEMELSKFKMK